MFSSAVSPVAGMSLVSSLLPFHALVTGPGFPMILRNDLLPPTGGLVRGAAVGSEGNADLVKLAAGLGVALLVFVSEKMCCETGGGWVKAVDDEDAHGVERCGCRNAGALLTEDVATAGATLGKAGKRSAGRDEGPAVPGTDDEAARATLSHT